MRRPYVIALQFLIAAVLLTCAGFELPLVALAFLALGWVLFLIRVVPQAQVGWAGVATALVLLAAFAAGLHAFLAWIAGQMDGGADGTPRRWSPRWTGAIVAVVVLMFVSGLATVGAVHQVGWLLTSKEPSVGVSMQAARRAQSVNNLKQVGLATHNYQSQQDTLPAPTFDREGRPLHAWLTRLLPYNEQTGLSNQIDPTLPWDDPKNASAFRTVVPPYLNPGIRTVEEKDAAGYALAHYAENARMIGVRSFNDVTDGTSQTILAGEVAGGFRPWGDPVNWRDPAKGINRAPDGFGGPYRGGANVLFADGSVRFIKDSVDPRVVEALGTPAGRDPVSADSY